MCSADDAAPPVSAGPDTTVVHLSRPTIQGDLAAAIGWLRDPAGGGCQAVFTLGFCMGGRVSFLASSSERGLAGAIGFYGAPGMAGPYRDPGPTQLADQLTARSSP